ncbi:MAG: hypothetical protein K2Y08_03830 [Alphaproteobacteria bacterium]|nr:hypothetical protein [Alphaproteobacteria bacterium]
MLKRQNFSLFCVMVIGLFLSSGHTVYAMDDDEHNPSPQVMLRVEDDGLDTEEAESEEIVDVRASIINDVKAAMPQYQKGDLEIMRWVNRMCKEYKITQKELGVESNPWPQDPKEVSELPLKERFAAIQKVTPDNRWVIPRILREKVFRFELSKIKDPKERAAKTDTLKSQLALHVCEFTNSQEEAHNETFPSLLNESIRVGRQLMSVEMRKKRLLTFSESTPESIAKKMKEDFEMLNLEQELLEESRREIVDQQKPLVRKITRNFSVDNFKN